MYAGVGCRASVSLPLGSLALMAVIVSFCVQAEDGIRDLVRSRGLGDVYKRQQPRRTSLAGTPASTSRRSRRRTTYSRSSGIFFTPCLLYTSDAADERSSVDLGGRRIIKKKKSRDIAWCTHLIQQTLTYHIVSRSIKDG